MSKTAQIILGLALMGIGVYLMKYKQGNDPKYIGAILLLAGIFLIMRQIFK